MSGTNQVSFELDQILPKQADVMVTQGIPPETTPSERIQSLYRMAEELFLAHAKPVGIMADISTNIFSDIYPGIGKNAHETPLEAIYPHASALALFAFTQGPELGDMIEKKFKENLAVGYMLDAIASFSTDMASHVAEYLFFRHLTAQSEIYCGNRVLLYSPGYCGWHVSGQEKLFDYLRPEQIGIRLTDSSLMVPLKSISGVLVAGAPSIHRFADTYPFCATCKTRTCRGRQPA